MGEDYLEVPQANATPVLGDTAASGPLPSSQIEPDNSCGFWRILVAAAPWSAVALFLALLASDLEDARREADILITPTLTIQERDDIYAGMIDPFRGKAGVYLVAAATIALLGVVSLWFLF